MASIIGKTFFKEEPKPYSSIKSKNDIRKSHWPNGSRLVISFSMQFETGGQPEGAESPFSIKPLPIRQLTMVNPNTIIDFEIT